MEFPVVTLGLAVANVVIFALFPLPGTLEAAVQGIGVTLSLLVFGALLERKVGPAKLLIIYLLSGFVAAVFSITLALGNLYVAFAALAAASGVAGASLFACLSDGIPLAFAFLLIFPGIAYFAFLAPAATIGTLGSYIFIVLGIPAVTFVLLHETTALLLPFLVAWAVLQLGMGLYWMSAQVMTGAVWAPLLGLAVGIGISFKFFRK